MVPHRLFIVCLFCCHIKMGSTRCRSKALFPAANRIRRGVATVANPTFYSSFKDVHLLFEILLAGINFDVSGEFSVNDGELASLRKTRNLSVICEEIIPKELSHILRLISDLSTQSGRLHQDDFERTLMTLVYTAERMVNSTDKHQKDMWAESFVSLYRALKQDLTGVK